MRLSRFERIFIRIARNYVGLYKDHAFRFYFDDARYPLIGGGPEVVEVRFHHAEALFKAVFAEGSVGLGESYCKGWIEVDDRLYKHFLAMLIRTVYQPRLLLRLPAADIFYILRAKFNRQFFTKKDKSENINSHYSLSEWFADAADANAFYLFWLDAHYIQYTCGKWDEDTRTLEEAQENKLAFYADRMGIDQNARGKTMIDLGCGWGGSLFYMAEKFGIKTKGITLSTAQAAYIRKEAARRGLEDLVSVEVDDVHNAAGAYDYVISIGLLEHITDYHHLYRRVAGLLKKGGTALFHAIFHTERFYKVDPFLSKYIFPGGSTPGIRSNLRIFRKYFKVVDRNNLPDNSYPKTLACWYDRFCRNEGAIRKLLAEKSSVKDIDFAVRMFKHYLVLAQCGLSDNLGLVANIMLKTEVAAEPDTAPAQPIRIPARSGA